MLSGKNNLHSKLYNIDSALKLINYTSMPARDEAWLSGFSSAEIGEDLDDNPYSVSDPEYSQWVDGWWTGFYGDAYTANFLISCLDREFDLETYKREFYKDTQIKKQSSASVLVVVMVISMSILLSALLYWL
jgi:hypothetical protein